MTDQQDLNTPRPMLAVFCSPSRYVQGANATAELGSVLSAMGLTGPALIVASARIEAELGATWARTLGSAGIPFVVHRFNGECTQDEITAGVAAARAAGRRTGTAPGRAHWRWPAVTGSDARPRD